MNKLKTNARILLIIIISVFAIIPFVSILSSKMFGIHEGMDDYDMTDKIKKMDRINVDGVSYTTADGSQDGISGEYLYCVGGDITCADGSLTSDTSGGTYKDPSDNEHNSYQYSCGSDSQSYPVCVNSMSLSGKSQTTFVDSDINETILNGPTDE